MRNDRERLLDIVEMCDNLHRYVAGGGRERMERDPTVLAAAERWVEVLGEERVKTGREGFAGRMAGHGVGRPPEPVLPLFQQPGA